MASRNLRGDLHNVNFAFQIPPLCGLKESGHVEGIPRDFAKTVMRLYGVGSVCEAEPKRDESFVFFKESTSLGTILI